MANIVKSKVTSTQIVPASDKSKQQKSVHRININVTKAYFGFLFQTFLKRPFGYIIALLFILYLAVILMIVPAATQKNPLFIWTIGGFNMPMFNLFFIAAMASSIAVILFKVGVDDGTELSLSAKPITKGRRVAIKTATYIIIMLIICAITIAILSLIKPIFGEYDIIFNRTGITTRDYRALLLSVLVGNLVNMLLFGGLAVLISLVGGQVITMIGSIGVAFLMCLLNFIYPLAAGTPKSVIKNSYNTSINSLSCVTKGQITGLDQATNAKPFAAIQCVTEESGVELNHLDTYEYWTKANKESGTFVTNYLDFGKQLSSLYSGFGLDENRLLQASQVSIGTNLSYKYIINKKTNIASGTSVDAGAYPVALYTMYSKQGVNYPVVKMLGGNTGLDSDNWTVFSKINGFDFNSLNVVSIKANAPILLPLLQKHVNDETYYNLDLLWKDKTAVQKVKEKKTAENLLNTYLDNVAGWDPTDYSKDTTVADSAVSIISSDTSNTFFEPGKWNILTVNEKNRIISQIQVYWIAKAQELQNAEINKYINDHPELSGDSFPYSSVTVMSWYGSKVVNESGVKGDYYYKQKLLEQVLSRGIYADTYVGLHEEDLPYYIFPINSSLDFCETYNNLYQYGVRSYFNVYALTAIWTSIAIALFAASIIIYKNTDFK